MLRPAQILGVALPIHLVVSPGVNGDSSPRNVAGHSSAMPLRRKTVAEKVIRGAVEIAPQ